jgi:dienelactone hydrolase
MRLLATLAAALALGATPSFDYDASAPLRVQEAGVQTYDGVAVHDLSYASPVRGRVPAYLVLPPGKGPFPVVLFAPGSGGTRDELIGDAEDLAHRGVAGVLFTPPILRPNGPYLTTCNAAKDVDTVVQYVKEMRRAVDVIASRPELDSHRIGYVGFSLGADFGAILAGVEHRIRAYALQSGRGHFSVLPAAQCRQQVGARRGAAYAKMYAVVDGVRYVRHASPAAILIQNGTQDPISPRADVLALYRAANGPKTVRFYRSPHRLPPAATAFRDGWLLARLR